MESTIIRVLRAVQRREALKASDGIYLYYRYMLMAREAGVGQHDVSVSDKPLVEQVGGVVVVLAVGVDVHEEVGLFQAAHARR